MRGPPFGSAQLVAQLRLAPKTDLDTNGRAILRVGSNGSIREEREGPPDVPLAHTA